LTRAALQKSARSNVDKSLSSQRKFEMILENPDLTQTDKLMLTLKHSRDMRSENRKSEREHLLNDMKDVKNRSRKFGKMLLDVHLKKTVVDE
jgi:hypothetical protein